jgi:ribose 5-phosphate isomerase B
MVIYFGADHRGFPLKEILKAEVLALGFEVVDCGAKEVDPNDDYVDFASAVSEEVARTEDSRGILICASGAGMCIAANKFKGVRAAIGIANDQVYSARHDDSMNVLCIASDYANEEQARGMLKVFLETPFGNDERFLRRLNKVEQLEHD